MQSITDAEAVLWRLVNQIAVYKKEASLYSQEKDVRERLRLLQATHDRLERGIKDMSLIEEEARRIIETAKAEAGRLISSNKQLNQALAQKHTELAIQKTILEDTMTKAQLELEEATSQANARLDARDAKVKQIENDLIYKDNEFKRIAVDLGKRETDLAELSKSNERLVATIITRQEEQKAAEVRMASLATDVTTRGIALSEREATIVSNEKTAQTALESAKNQQIVVNDLITVNNERKTKLDIQEANLAKREQNIAKDRKAADNALKLLRDRERMYAKRRTVIN